MGRIRTIKPEFFFHEQLTQLSPLTRILFVGLWTLADKEGRLKDRERTVKAQLLPFDNHDVGKALDDLQKIGCLERYEINGERFIQITNWLKHQRPHHTEKNSEFPERGNSPLIHGETTVSSRQEGKGKEGKGKEGKEYCSSKTMNDVGFEDFWKFYPRKQAKPAAQRAWKKLNPSPNLCVDIYNHIHRTKSTEQWEKDEGKFIPMPATYLNQRRWEDEAPKVLSLEERIKEQLRGTQ